VFKRRYALVGFLAWMVGKQVAKRRLRRTGDALTRPLPLAAVGSLAAFAIALAAWRLGGRRDDASAA
jgi:hypothetical protein